MIFLHKALDLDPGNTGLLLRLASIYRAMGDTGQALDTYGKILKLLSWGNHPHAREARYSMHTITRGTAPLPAES